MPPRKTKRHDPLDEWQSAWFITINTQSTDMKIVEPLRDAWKYITQRMAFFTSSDVEGAEILSVRDRPVIEIGPRYHRVHLHTQLAIDGRGLIMLDYVEIRKFINDLLRQSIPTFKKVYFSAKLVRNYNATRTIERYLAKAPILQTENPFQI